MSNVARRPLVLPQLSVLIPVKNEAENVSSLVKRLDASLTKAAIKYEIIIIDDHSTDETQNIVKGLLKHYPVKLLVKQGKPGKAFSIFEGAAVARSEWLAMIDGDLQYPPEAIPEMYQIAQAKGVAVARRVSYEGSALRRLGSRCVAWFTGQFLHGIGADVQSGLKVFKKTILDYLPTQDVTPWALDLPLLHTALELGYTIGEVNITFEKRQYGESKLSFLKPTMDIGVGALKLKFQPHPPINIAPENESSMIGAGLIHKRHRFVTHSTLHHKRTALHTITKGQRRLIVAILAAVILGALLNAKETAIILVAFLSFVYFVDVIFNFFLILKSLHTPPELEFDADQIASVADDTLPIYSILCPLYKEAHVLPGFVEAISHLDWPKAKLDVLLLFEEDDAETIEAVKHMKLPSYFRVVIVPDSQPKTKPKACNYGLNLAKGEYVVIYDAEDIPEPNQLKKAYLGFQTVGPNVKCLQAKLNYYNPNQNWLTRFFTAEYSLWFDVILTGLQSIETNIPLGGTSNHFRTQDLLDLKGWDPFNVTEDCDLGIRLFREGNKTAIIDSTTLEEANSNFKNWIRQRSRWIKGYMQTYLIHMRQPIEFARSQGWHALLFQLTIGGKLAFILINPILWILTISYFALYAYVGPTIESLYPSVVFYMAVTSLVFGNFMFIYYYMIGCAKREHWGLIKWVYLIPFYWLMVSMAGAIALYQLIVKPHYWEKTVHGLHLKKKALQLQTKKTTKRAIAQVLTEASVQSKPDPQLFVFSREKFAQFKSIYHRLRTRSLSASAKLFTKEYRGGVVLIAATLFTNILNLATNVFMGHELQFADFALMNTFISLLYLISIPFGALSTTVNHRTAQVLGKHRLPAAKLLWEHLIRRGVAVGTMLAGVWLIMIPWTKQFFHLDSVWPLLLFTPLLITGLVGAINEGYLRGRLWFESLAVAILIEPLVRLVLTVTIGESPFVSYLFLSIPIAAISTVLVSWQFANKGEPGIDELREFRLPFTFYSLALIARLSSIAFFSLDNVMVAHFLSKTEVGMYGLLGLIGKMIFFAGSLTAGFIIPIVAHREGHGQNSQHIFQKLLILTFGLSTSAYIALALVLPALAPYFLGEKINAIAAYLPWYGLGILGFTLAQTVVSFHLARKEYSFAVVSFLIAIGQVAGLWLYNGSIANVVTVMVISGVMNAVLLFGMHFNYRWLRHVFTNFQDFFDLFKRIPAFTTKKMPVKQQYRILIFNWRDTKHVWAGGAEQYIHEIAKRLVQSGHQVTVFCGNDNKNKRYEVVDGVRVVRRGGFYTVYIWAILYYVLRFRKQFDIVIDSENGVPFLTPLFVQEPVFLLIHHIHQEVFRTQLRFPLSEIAAFIESDVMPFVYQRHHILTVSPSSKKEIVAMGIGDSDKVDVINPGITAELFKPTRKTKQPSLVYVGRLKPYKNIDVAIKAFAEVAKRYPKATFTIAGEGESSRSLKLLTHRLNIEDQVVFTGRISDEKKASLLAKSWVAIQPSMIEGWGITVIEANACGTPVVASNVKGLRDSIVDGETGLLVKPKSESEFAEAITSLFASTAKRTKFAKAALKWSEAFTWENSYRHFLALVTKKLGKDIILDLRYRSDVAHK